jgi:glycine/D-amino acid oxidase-like deaminating enzyme/nitrite reductase/ring-hydroxylating ferredoxin subunit
VTLRATDSLWLDTAAATSFPSLEHDLTVDVAVIGGGIAGITTALLLKREGLRVAVLERGVVAGAATGMTTAKVSALQDTVLPKVPASARATYAQANLAAIDRMEELVDEHSIECDWERAADHVYAASEEDVSSIDKVVEAATGAGLKAERVNEVPLPFDVAAAARLKDQAQFQPVAYTRALADLVDGEGSSVFESTMVTGLTEGPPHEISIDGGVAVTARHVVVATQYPLLDRGLFFARLEATRSYCIAGELKGERPEGMYISAGSPTRSVRRWRDWLIVGGEGHHTGASDAQPERYERLAEFGREHFGVTEFPYRWSTQDGMPSDHVPYIGRYHPRADGLWAAGGFQKWGMSNATVAGILLTELIAGRNHPWAETFNPNRVSVGAAPELAKLGLLTGLHFVGDRLLPAESSVEDLPPGEARVVRSGLGKIGVYRDDAGELHAVSLRCTHLGCLTRWNDAERSWDCPCHGSRFDVDGAVLSGPAVRPLERRDPPA